MKNYLIDWENILEGIQVSQSHRWCIPIKLQILTRKQKKVKMRKLQGRKKEKVMIILRADTNMVGKQKEGKFPCTNCVFDHSSNDKSVTGQCDKCR